MEIIEKIGILLIGLLVICILLGVPLMFLWNWLMPVIFGLKTISFWQAVGLNLMCGILFRANVKTKKE